MELKQCLFFTATILSLCGQALSGEHLCSAYARNSHNVSMLFKKPAWASHPQTEDYHLIINCTAWPLFFDTDHLTLQFKYYGTNTSQVPFFDGHYFAALNIPNEDNCFDVILLDKQNLESAPVGRAVGEKCYRNETMESSIDISQYRTVRIANISGLEQFGLDSYEGPIAIQNPLIDSLDKTWSSVFFMDATGKQSPVAITLLRDGHNFRAEPSDDLSTGFVKFNGTSVPHRVIAIWPQMAGTGDPGYLMFMQDDMQVLRYCWLKYDQMADLNANCAIKEFIIIGQNETCDTGQNDDNSKDKDKPKNKDHTIILVAMVVIAVVVFIVFLVVIAIIYCMCRKKEVKPQRVVLKSSKRKSTEDEEEMSKKVPLSKFMD